jgi:hypothetical protein
MAPKIHRATNTPPSSWRVAIANLLDFFTIALSSGYSVAWNSGTLIPGGFYLEGWSIGLVFGIIVAYFLICNRYLGGAIWAHMLVSTRN